MSSKGEMIHSRSSIWCALFNVGGGVFAKTDFFEWLRMKKNTLSGFTAH